MTKTEELLRDIKMQRFGRPMVAALQLCVELEAEAVLASQLGKEKETMQEYWTRRAERAEAALHEIVDGDPAGGTYSGSQCVDIAYKALHPERDAAPHEQRQEKP